MERRHKRYELEIDNFEEFDFDGLVLKHFDNMPLVDKTREIVMREKELLLSSIRAHQRRLRERQTKIRTGVQVRREKIFRKLHEPPVIRYLDKLSFCGGVVITHVTEWLLLCHPDWMLWWYAGVIVALSLFRFYTYRKLVYHYFMLDFCYFLNSLLLCYIFLLPTSSMLFEGIWISANGSVLFAIPLWGNALVFHDVDKTTSFFIHLMPPLVTYCLRWKKDLIVPHFAINEEFTSFFWFPLFLYLFWQLSYYLKLFLVDKSKIKEHKSIQFSYRWMVRSHAKRNTVQWRMVNVLGPDYKLVGFMLFQLGYTILVSIPAYFMYYSHEFHCFCLLACVAFAVWNGARFYIDKFSKDYMKQFVS